MKKVIKVKQEIEVVGLKDVSEDKIYVSKGHLGLHKLSQINNVWQFCALRNSHFNDWGSYGSLESAIEFQISNYEVFEFNSEKEFLTWALENSKS